MLNTLWGFEARSFDADYDYFNRRLFLDEIGTPPGALGCGVTEFDRSFSFADFLTLVSSALRNDLDVWAYLKDVLDRLLAGDTGYGIMVIKI